MECIAPELEAVLADARARMADGLPSGPEYAQPPGCNPERFQGVKQEFVSGSTHLEQHRKAWHAIRPEPPGEVLSWVDEMYEVKIEEEGRGIKKRNGAVARANAEDLSLLLYQLLEQGSWEAVRVNLP